MFAPKITSSGEQLRKRPGVDAGLVVDRLDALARLVRRAVVRARLAQRARDRVADLVRHLRAAGRVEEGEAAVLERGEARTDALATSNRVVAMERAYPRVILGCGNFGGIGSAPAFFGQGENQEQAFELLDAAYEAGLTWLDTADAYGGGRSETYIGEWIRSRRPDGRAHHDEDVRPDGGGR